MNVLLGGPGSSSGVSNPTSDEKIDRIDKALEEFKAETKILREDNEKKNEDRFQRFYTVFGILFAVFAIGGFVGSNYSGLDLVALWILAVGLLGIFLSVSLSENLKMLWRYFPHLLMFFSVVLLGLSIWMVWSSSRNESIDRKDIADRIEALEASQRESEKEHILLKDSIQNAEEDNNDLRDEVGDLEKRLNNARIR